MELDPVATYAQLLIALRELLLCSAGAVIVPTGSGATIAAQFGPSSLRSPIGLTPATNQVLAQLAQTRRPLLIERDAPFQPPLPAPAKGRVWIGAPMILGEQLYCNVS